MKNSDARSAENDLHDFSANLHKLPTKPQAPKPLYRPVPQARLTAGGAEGQRAGGAGHLIVDGPD